jgi:hypothetical protein
MLRGDPLLRVLGHEFWSATLVAAVATGERLHRRPLATSTPPESELLLTRGAKDDEDWPQVTHPLGADARGRRRRAG